MGPMESMRDLRLGEILDVLHRYKPVAVSVVVVLAALLVLPKPDFVATSATGPNRIETPTLDGQGESTSVDAAPVEVFSGEGFGADAFGASTPSFVAGPSSDSSGFSGSGSASGSGSGSSFSGPTPGADGASTTTTTAAPTPLRVRSSTWASRSAGTPLAATGVPEATLPVGTRGSDDKLSFVRLSGTATILGLAEHPDGNRTNAGPVAVRACQIKPSDWKAGAAVAFADAPAYDPADCVAGARSQSGVWLFDLSAYDSRADNRGFALVPGAGAGVDFQVAFRIT